MQRSLSVGGKREMCLWDFWYGKCGEFLGQGVLISCIQVLEGVWSTGSCLRCRDLCELKRIVRDIESKFRLTWKLPWVIKCCLGHWERFSILRVVWVRLISRSARERLKAGISIVYMKEANSGCFIFSWTSHFRRERDPWLWGFSRVKLVLDVILAVAPLFHQYPISYFLGKDCLPLRNFSSRFLK